jgi:hypothetical protein
VQDWKLKKNGLHSAEGTVDFDGTEQVVTTDEDACHTCASGRQGGRIAEKTTTIRTTIKGISTTSKEIASDLDDARVEIRFKEDSTYLVHVKAASSKGTVVSKIVDKIEGTCDTRGQNESHTNRRDVPFEDVLGPFPGGPLDKKLKVKDKRVIKDTPEEKVYHEFDFTLTRD